MTKLYASAKEALEGVLLDGMTIMVGGFGLCGIPENSIQEIKNNGVKNLTIISNNCGVDDWGLGILLQNKQIKKMVSSYVGDNKLFAAQLLSKELEVELVPQGTLAERIRAGGSGIPAFYTRTGYGTDVAIGKEVKVFDSKEYIMERALKADLAIVRAYMADEEGNLIFRKTARNFNPMMATAGKVVVAEVEHYVRKGDINPDHVHTPGIYVNRIFVGKQEKKIEKLTLAAK